MITCRRLFQWNDLENPSRFGNGGGSQTFNRWIKHLRVVSTSGSAHPVLVEYDAVPVEYLPPRTRSRLMITKRQAPD